MESTPLIAAFLAGLLSFFSPCVLPLVPAYISYISGVAMEDMMTSHLELRIRRVILLNALFFCLGFSLVFVVLGASATFLGQFFLAHLQILCKLAGILIIVLGLHIAGFLRINFLYREKRIQLQKKRVGIGWSFLAGFAFAFGWTPCIGPILAGILVLAGTRETMGDGILLLSLYSLGLSIPFILTALAVESFWGTFERAKKHFRKIEIASGILLILIGILIFTGDLQWIGSSFTASLGCITDWIEMFEQKLLHF